MGEVIKFNPSVVPDFLRKIGADDVTNALAGGGGGMRRISIKGNAFREMIGGKEFQVSEERSMNVVIVRAAPTSSRTYYEGTYSEGESKPPVCWSSDAKTPDAAPSTT